jgi:16S rRNA (cytidine1402-2'-O)-methyltransferase
MALKPGLYIVSTPIGNLEDITLRAISTLEKSDYIFCEDSKSSIKLLAKHSINRPLKLYNDHSDEKMRQYIIELIRQGKVISLISDAGTPLISDPGYKLVRDVKTAGLHLDIAPGPCAAIAALTLSALPTDRFMFCGFLPKTSEGKRIVFTQLVGQSCPMIFYEAASRIIASCQVALEVMGDRQANIGRELTKLYQESRTCRLSELIAHYKNHPPKGEIVLIISGASSQGISYEGLENEVQKMMKEECLSAKSTATILHQKYKKHFSKDEIYKIANKYKASR